MASANVQICTGSCALDAETWLMDVRMDGLQLYIQKQSMLTTVNVDNDHSAYAPVTVPSMRLMSSCGQQTTQQAFMGLKY
jgi:hypothetical protein